VDAPKSAHAVNGKKLADPGKASVIISERKSESW
jgi:hypothetical protein